MLWVDMGWNRCAPVKIYQNGAEARSIRAPLGVERALGLKQMQ